MNKIKHYYKTISVYWDIKTMIKQLCLFTILLVLMCIIVDTTLPLFMLIVVWVVPVVIITVSWFSTIKPIVLEVSKEVELEDKYPFMYGRFIK